MHKFYTSSFDASIYLQQPEQNAGRDQILEVGKLYYGDIKDIARSLIKFDITPISSSISNGDISGSWKAFINLKSANSAEIPLEYSIYANAISQSWTMGTGTKFDNISNDGVSWYYKNGTDKWMDYVSIPNSYVSGSDTGSITNGGGGTWYTASMASQSFNNEPDDIRMDVTNIISRWVSGSLPNNGLIIHHGLSNESDILDYGVLKFFSKETGTIYQPKLELAWNDFTFSSSLSIVTGSAEDGYKVVLTNLKNEYQKDSKIKIRVKGRDSYPSKTFGTTFAYDQNKYIPITSYYQLEDYITGEIIFPFGDYTKISCDNTSNYFVMDLNSLPTNRTYKLKLEIVENGISTLIDDKLIFQIID